MLPLLDDVDGDVRAIGAANDLTIEAGRLIGHNNDGKGVVMLGAGVAHLTLITRRQEQVQEVADTVMPASGVPAVWQAWEGEAVVPAGTSLLMNATHLVCAP